jgi:hypothetical protein
MKQQSSTLENRLPPISRNMVTEELPPIPINMVTEELPPIPSKPGKTGFSTSIIKKKMIK